MAMQTDTINTDSNEEDNSPHGKNEKQARKNLHQTGKVIKLSKLFKLKYSQSREIKKRYLKIQLKSVLHNSEVIIKTLLLR